MLSVSVVPSVSDRSCHGVRNDVLMTCFRGVFLSGTMRSARSVQLEETAFGGTRALSVRSQAAPIFFEHLMSCPRPMRHAGQQCPPFCGIGMELDDAEGAVL